MSTCKTCKHWIGSDAGRVGVCGEPRVRLPVSVPKFCDGIIIIPERDAIGVDNGNTLTGPEFGCIHHQ